MREYKWLPNKYVLNASNLVTYRNATVARLCRIGRVFPFVSRNGIGVERKDCPIRADAISCDYSAIITHVEVSHPTPTNADSDALDESFLCRPGPEEPRSVISNKRSLARMKPAPCQSPHVSNCPRSRLDVHADWRTLRNSKNRYGIGMGHAKVQVVWVVLKGRLTVGASSNFELTWAVAAYVRTQHMPDSRAGY